MNKKILKRVDLKSKFRKVIRFEKINPFVNVCAESGEKEFCNIEVEYIPKDSVIEIMSYRKFFKDNIFNLHIEALTEEIFLTISDLIKPEWLKVTIYLEDEQLTPWSVTIEDWI